MIPLNKPTRPNQLYNKKHNDFLKSCSTYYNYYFPSSRHGLNVIYKELFKDYGSLVVGVSPLVCYDALYPILNNGHTILFIDIDINTLNIDLSKVDYSKINVLQIIHLGGNPCNMSMLNQIKDNVIIIEDCAQAMGSKYNNQYVGTFGEYSVFSLIKNLHLSMGGLLLSQNQISFKAKPISNSTTIYKDLKHFLEGHTSYKTFSVYSILYKTLLHIKEKKVSNNSNPAVLSLPEKFTEKFKTTYEYLDDYTKKRRDLFDKYNTSLNNNFTFQKEESFGYSNRNRILMVSEDNNAKEIISKLRIKGIAANNLSQNYLKSFQENIQGNKYFRKYNNENLTKYHNIYPRLIAIPCSPALTEKEQDYIIKSINSL